MPEVSPQLKSAQAVNHQLTHPWQPNYQPSKVLSICCLSEMLSFRKAAVADAQAASPDHAHLPTAVGVSTLVVMVVMVVVVMIWLDHGHDLDGFPAWI
jgi:hypothetical protein